MNCRKVNHLLSAYMDGELPGVEHRQIREHLMHCVECCQEYEALLRMKRLLAQMGLREPQNSLATRIVRHIHLFETTQTVRTSGRAQATRKRFFTLASARYLTLGVGLTSILIVAVMRTPSAHDSIHWLPDRASEYTSQEAAPINILNPRPDDPFNRLVPVNNLYSRPMRPVNYVRFGPLLDQRQSMGSFPLTVFQH